MNDREPLPRSPDLMSRHDTALLVIDVQEKLLPAIHEAELVVWNIHRLVEAARLFGVPVFATEQYPKGLGPTVEPLAGLIEQRHEKTAFSCGVWDELFRQLADQGRYKLAIAGIEAHVCVLQTVFDLLTDGFQPYVHVDAVGSRRPLDRDAALRRFESAGAWLTTTETTMFEWCESAADPQFKQLSALVRRQRTPGKGEA